MEQHSAGATPFAHVHAPKAVLYRAVMRVFVDAKRRFQVHQRPEDVHDALQPSFERADVDAGLVSLAEWGNLRADVDTSRVTSVADFYRPRCLYQLTPEGEGPSSRWPPRSSARRDGSGDGAAALLRGKIARRFEAKLHCRGVGRNHIEVLEGSRQLCRPRPRPALPCHQFHAAAGTSSISCPAAQMKPTSSRATAVSALCGPRRDPRCR
jgi:hypothetical protein